MQESVIRVRFVLNLFQTLRYGWATTLSCRFGHRIYQVLEFVYIESPCNRACVWALVFRLYALYEHQQILMIAEQRLCPTSQ